MHPPVVRPTREVGDRLGQDRPCGGLSRGLLLWFRQTNDLVDGVSNVLKNSWSE
jgi:hypothetical protein